MFWINAENATYKANFDFWDISHLNYDLFVWDIFLIIMTFIVILAIIWIDSLSFSFQSPISDGPKSWAWNSRSSKSLGSWQKQLWTQKALWEGSWYQSHWSFKIYR